MFLALLGTVLACSLEMTTAVQLPQLQEPAGTDPELDAAWTPLDCDNDYVLLYTVPKTGSTEMLNSLKESCGLESKSASWSSEHLKKVHDNHDEAAEWLASLPFGSTVWIITLVRNPFARFISGYFENLKDGLSGDESSNHRRAVVSSDHYKDEVQVNDLVRDFRANFLPVVSQSTGYFTKQTNVTGMDLLRPMVSHAVATNHVFFHPRTADDGTHRRHVVLRLEDIEHWGQLTMKFFPLWQPSDNGNLARHVRDPWLRQMHEDFVQRYEYTDSELERCMTAEELTFYTEDEIRGFVDDLKGHTWEDYSLVRNAGR